MMKMLSILTLFIIPLALAQDYQFALSGKYPTQPGVFNEVQFTVKWDENNGNIKGVYSDNFYSGEAPVHGRAGESGRNFEVVLPEVNQGVKFIDIALNQSGEISGTIPVIINLKDALGNYVSTTTTEGAVSSFSRGAAPLSACSFGFGLLTGYCGLYEGEFQEVSDPQNRCHFEALGEMRLELAITTHFNLYLGFRGSLEGIPKISISNLLNAPLETSVNQMNRICGPIEGATMVEMACKRVSLSGSFFENRGIRSFVGTFSVQEEGNNQRVCRYNLDLKREKAY